MEVSDVGQMIVRVTINPLLRSVAPAAELQSAIGDVRLPLLRNFEVQMLVGVDGVVEEVGSRTQALESLAALDVPGQQLLLKTCSDGVVGSWFAHPFWLTAPAEQLREDGSWQRVDRHSMGLLGELQTAATIAVTDIDARRATVEIQGSSRLVAADAAEEQPGSQLIEFSDVAVQVDDFSGTGTMEFHAPSPTAPDTQQPSQSGDSDAPPDLPAPEEPDPNPPATDEVQPADDAALPMPRPWFEEITVRLAYSGTATVTANGQKSALRFTQQQTSTSRLQMYQIQRPAPDIRSIPLRQR